MEDVPATPAPAKQRVQQEFQSLFAVTFPALARAVHLIVQDRAVAEEITRGAFTRLLLHWKRVSRYDSPDLWVRRVAIRQAQRNAARQDGRLERRPARPVDELVVHDDLVLRAVASLAPEQRAIVVLRYLEDRPKEEIAELVGCSVASGWSQLRSARQRLAETLSETVPGDSVDSRLHEGLVGEDHSWEADTASSYDAVIEGARRVVRRNTTIGAVAAVAALTIGLSLVPGQGPRSVAPVVPKPSVFSTVTYPTSRLDGRWHTRLLGRAAVNGSLEEAGMNGVAGRWHDSEPRGRARLTLVSAVVGGFVLWLGSDRDPYAELLDWGDITVDGDRVEFTPMEAASPHATFRWTITGNRLRFELIETDRPGRNGVSGAALVRALYTELPFTRFYGVGP
jgi:RNA polymerase sigma factor (sigma-70 family)